MWLQSDRLREGPSVIRGCSIRRKTIRNCSEMFGNDQVNEVCLFLTQLWNKILDTEHFRLCSRRTFLANVHYLPSQLHYCKYF